jgi:hypothetical protein
MALAFVEPTSSSSSCLTFCPKRANARKRRIDSKRKTDCSDFLITFILTSFNPAGWSGGSTQNLYSRGTISILTEVSYDFPSSLQANARIEPCLVHNCFLQNPFQYISHPTIWHHSFNTESVINWALRYFFALFAFFSMPQVTEWDYQFIRRQLPNSWVWNQLIERKLSW